VSCWHHFSVKKNEQLITEVVLKWHHFSVNVFSHQSHVGMTSVIFYIKVVPTWYNFSSFFFLILCFPKVMSWWQDFFIWTRASMTRLTHFCKKKIKKLQLFDKKKKKLQLFDKKKKKLHLCYPFATQLWESKLSITNQTFGRWNSICNIEDFYKKLFILSSLQGYFLKTKFIYILRI